MFGNPKFQADVKAISESDPSVVVSRLLIDDKPSILIKYLDKWRTNSSDETFKIELLYILKEAVGKKAYSCVDKLIKLFAFDKESIDQLIKDAADKMDGLMVWGLSKNNPAVSARALFNSQFNVERNVDEDKLKLLFQHLLRFMPLDIVDNLHKTYLAENDFAREVFTRVYQNAKSEFLAAAPFFSRYLRPSNLQEINTTYSTSGSDYLQRDMKYGEKRSKLADQIVASLNKDSKQITPESEDFLALPTSSSKTRRAAAILEKVGTFVSEDQKNQIFRQARYRSGHVTPLQYRYSTALPLVRSVYRYSHSNDVAISQNKAQKRKYQLDKLSYALFKPGEDTILNRVILDPRRLNEQPQGKRQKGWYHGQVAVKETWNDIENTFEDILAMDLSNKNEENLTQFYRQAAKLVWLIGNTQPLTRGSGSYAEFMLAIIHKHHKMDPPILKTTFPQLDVLDITFPLNDYQFLFSYFFEPSSLPEPLRLKFKDIDTSLSINKQMEQLYGQLLHQEKTNLMKMLLESKGDNAQQILARFNKFEKKDFDSIFSHFNASEIQVAAKKLLLERMNQLFTYDEDSIRSIVNFAKTFDLPDSTQEILKKKSDELFVAYLAKTQIKECNDLVDLSEKIDYLIKNDLFGSACLAESKKIEEIFKQGVIRFFHSESPMPLKAQRCYFKIADLLRIPNEQQKDVARYLLDNLSEESPVLRSRDSQHSGHTYKVSIKERLSILERCIPFAVDDAEILKKILNHFFWEKYDLRKPHELAQKVQQFIDQIRQAMPNHAFKPQQQVVVDNYLQNYLQRHFVFFVCGHLLAVAREAPITDFRWLQAFLQTTFASAAKSVKNYEKSFAPIFKFIFDNSGYLFSQNEPDRLLEFFKFTLEQVFKNKQSAKEAKSVLDTLEKVMPNKKFNEGQLEIIAKFDREMYLTYGGKYNSSPTRTHATMFQRREASAPEHKDKKDNMTLENKEDRRKRIENKIKSCFQEAPKKVRFLASLLEHIEYCAALTDRLQNASQVQDKDKGLFLEYFEKIQINRTNPQLTIDKILQKMVDVFEYLEVNFDHVVVLKNDGELADAAQYKALSSELEKYESTLKEGRSANATDLQHYIREVVKAIGTDKQVPIAEFNQKMEAMSRDNSRNFTA